LVAAAPIGALPEQAAPTLGEVLATRLMPNCAVPVVELQPEAHATIVLDPEVSVVPEMVIVKPAVPLVAKVIVWEPVVAELVDKVPRATLEAPKLKLIVWFTVPETATVLLVVTTLTLPLSAMVPPMVMV